MEAKATVCINIPDGLHGEDGIRYFIEDIESINGTILGDIELD